MKIEIKNCNNIKEGTINIEDNKLNIKFGINGTGKSTTAKSIDYKVNKESDLLELLPFSLQKENPTNLKPEVDFSEPIDSVLVFNEEYVKRFLFKTDQLIDKSFEVFIKTDQYVQNEENIEEQLSEIKKLFSDNKDLEKIINDFENLSKNFKTTQSGLSKTAAIIKGVGSGFYNIPDELKDYEAYIQDKENCVTWLDWQNKGERFIDLHDNCPYCVSPVNIEKKDKIKSLSKHYDKTVIKNFVEIIRVLEESGDYFAPNSKLKLAEITKKTELLEEEEEFISAIKGQIDTFLQRLKNLRDISFYNLKDDSNIESKIEKLLINMNILFSHLKSEKTEKIIDVFNTSLEKVLEEITKLKAEIGKQKSEIKRLINKHERNINQFLYNAGYKYKVSIKPEVNDYKIKLQHVDSESAIFGGEQYLSFGERNAFALVLFMYETLSKDIDLIILDDPISSFDKNKKYAILQMLFRESESFKGKTVLMLTHDIEPILDSVKSSLSRKFQDSTNAHFIESVSGILGEKIILKDDILTFHQICEDIITDEDVHIILKLIYLRRKFEILDDKGDEYQILSDLVHKRTREEAKIDRKTRFKGLSDSDFDTSFQNGESEINRIVHKFNYDDLLKVISNNGVLIEVYNKLENGYEKLQLFRIINGDFTKDDNFSEVMKKFINETYHIENDFIHQLNPRKYNLIPEFIVQECDDYISSLAE